MHVYEKPVGRVAWLLGFIDLREFLYLACILDGTISVRREIPPSHQQEPIICLGMMNW
jgi:hypothetical protein